MASNCTAPQGKIESGLKCKLDKGEKANIMVSFADTSEVLKNVVVPQNASRGDRATAVNQALEAHMNRCQEGVANMLKEKGVQFKQFWISNSLSIQQATKEIAEEIAADPEVVRVREEQVAHLLNQS